MRESLLKKYMTDVSLEGVEEVEDDPTFQLNTEPTVDAVITDALESVHELNVVCEEIDELARTHESLEAYQSILTESLDNGGLNSDGAALLRLGMEQIEKSYGLEQKLTPAVEDFGGSASQLRSTEVSLEGAKDVLRTAWEQFKRAMEQLWKLIKDTFAKMTDASGRLSKRAAKVRARVSEAGGKAPSVTEIPVKGDIVFIDGKYAGEDVGRVKTLNDLINDKLVKCTVDTAEAYAKAINTTPIAEVLSGDFSPKGNTTKSIDSDLNKVGDKDGAAQFRTEPYHGNTRLYLSIDAEKMQLGSYFGQDRNLKGAPKDFKTEVPALPKLETTLKEIENTAKKIKEGKSSERLKSASDNLSKAIEKMKNGLPNDATDIQRQRAAEIIRKAGRLDKILNQSIVGANAHMIRVLNAQLQIAERQVATYSKGSDQKRIGNDKDE